MTQATIAFAQYVITGKSPKGVVQQTRTRAASAVVLAKKWMDAGYDVVEIVDPLGKVLSPDGYRTAIMKGGKVYR